MWQPLWVATLIQRESISYRNRLRIFQILVNWFMNIERTALNIALICIVSTVLLSGCNHEPYQWEHLAISYFPPKYIAERENSVIMLRDDGVFVLVGKYTTAGKTLKEGTAVMFNPPRVIYFPIKEVIEMYSSQKSFENVKTVVEEAAKRQQKLLNKGGIEYANCVRPGRCDS